MVLSKSNKKTYLIGLLGSLLLPLLLMQGCAPKSSLKQGSKAPEFALPTTKGDTVQLSDFKGQVVLLDFWASWCGPCRKNNPQFMEMYNHYSQQEMEGAEGFTMISISLDEDKDKWLAAIREDGLNGPVHLSDLKGGRSPVAAAYDVVMIPATYVISPEGTLVAVDVTPDKADEILSVYAKE